MIQVDIPMAFGVGSLMAHAAQKQLLTRKPDLEMQALAKVMIFHVIAFMWPPVYLLVYYFGFETSHMWWHQDSVLAYPWLFPAFFLVLFVANYFGFKLGGRFVRSGNAKRALMVFGAAVLFTTLWIVLQPDRTMTLGTYRDWQNGTAPAASSDTGFMIFVTIIIVGYTAGVWLVCRSLKRDGEQVQA